MKQKKKTIYDMAEEYDLDKIGISQWVYDTWLSYGPSAVKSVLSEADGHNITLSPSDIPDEQFRVHEDGTGEIFVPIQKIGKEIKMKVPSDEWSFLT